MGIAFSWLQRGDSLRQIWTEVLQESHEEVAVLGHFGELDEAANLIAKAFAGTTKTAPGGMTDWSIGTALRDGSIFSPLLMEPSLERIAAFKSVLSGAVFTAFLEEGIILKVIDECGKMIGCAVIEDKRKSGCFLISPRKLLSYFAARAMLCRERDKLNEDVNLRLQLLPGAQEHIHHAVLQGEAHLCVSLVAVDPAHQGEGNARNLVTAITDFGDSCELPIYLETSGKKNQRNLSPFRFQNESDTP